MFFSVCQVASVFQCIHLPHTKALYCVVPGQYQFLFRIFRIQKIELIYVMQIDRICLFVIYPGIFLVHFIRQDRTVKIFRYIPDLPIRNVDIIHDIVIKSPVRVCLILVVLFFIVLVFFIIIELFIHDFVRVGSDFAKLFIIIDADSAIDFFFRCLHRIGIRCLGWFR